MLCVGCVRFSTGVKGRGERRRRAKRGQARGRKKCIPPRMRAAAALASGAGTRHRPPHPPLVSAKAVMHTYPRDKRRQRSGRRWRTAFFEEFGEEIGRSERLSNAVGRSGPAHVHVHTPLPSVEALSSLTHPRIFSTSTRTRTRAHSLQPCLTNGKSRTKTKKRRGTASELPSSPIQAASTTPAPSLPFSHPPTRPPCTPWFFTTG